jgi:hypothetical protein
MHTEFLRGTSLDPRPSRPLKDSLRTMEMQCKERVDSVGSVEAIEDGEGF